MGSGTQLGCEATGYAMKFGLGHRMYGPSLWSGWVGVRWRRPRKGVPTVRVWPWGRYPVGIGYLWVGGKAGSGC